MENLAITALPSIKGYLMQDAMIDKLLADDFTASHSGFIVSILHFVLSKDSLPGPPSNGDAGEDDRCAHLHDDLDVAQ